MVISSDTWLHNLINWSDIYYFCVCILCRYKIQIRLKVIYCCHIWDGQSLLLDFKIVYYLEGEDIIFSPLQRLSHRCDIENLSRLFKLFPWQISRRAPLLLVQTFMSKTRHSTSTELISPPISSAVPQLWDESPPPGSLFLKTYQFVKHTHAWLCSIMPNKLDVKYTPERKKEVQSWHEITPAGSGWRSAIRKSVNAVIDRWTLVDLTARMCTGDKKKKTLDMWIYRKKTQ